MKSAIQPHPVGTVLTPKTGLIYTDLYFSDAVRRPGVIKLSDRHWQPCAVDLILNRGYVRGVRQAETIEVRTYPTLKAAIRAARAIFRQGA